MSRSRQPPHEAQPVVQRLRLRYRKTGRMRFGSARDFQRALERAVRRAGLPVAMSGGFNPHPRISYANAVPTGTASLAEYVELGLAERRDPDSVVPVLNAALPHGFAIDRAVESPGGALADLLEVSRWRIGLPGHDAAAIQAAAAAMLARAPVTVPRMTKSGLRDIAVTDHWVAHEAQDEALVVVVRAAVPTVRPDDIAGALQLGPVGLCTREEQGPWRDGTVADPLA